MIAGIGVLACALCWLRDLELLVSVVTVATVVAVAVAGAIGAGVGAVRAEAIHVV